MHSEHLGNAIPRLRRDAALIALHQVAGLVQQKAQRQLHRFAKFFDEPALPPPNPKPPADIGRNPSQKRSLYAPKS